MPATLLLGREIIGRLNRDAFRLDFFRSPNSETSGLLGKMMEILSRNLGRSGDVAPWRI